MIYKVCVSPVQVAEAESTEVESTQKASDPGAITHASKYACVAKFHGMVLVLYWSDHLRWYHLSLGSVPT